ncbi:MAG: addiction module protein, partial [Thermoanaerobaculia bacterium]
MDSRFSDVLDHALELPEEERADLADRLLASLEEEPDLEVEEAWRHEVARRLEELRSGAVKTIPWEEVRAG